MWWKITGHTGDESHAKLREQTQWVALTQGFLTTLRDSSSYMRITFQKHIQLPKDLPLRPCILKVLTPPVHATLRSKLLIQGPLEVIEFWNHRTETIIGWKRYASDDAIVIEWRYQRSTHAQVPSSYSKKHLQFSWKTT